MTTLQIPIFHHDVLAGPRIGPVEAPSKRKQRLMKAMLLGMMVSMSLGPLMIIQVETDVTLTRDFLWSMVGGTVGSALCLCVWMPASVREMARNLVGNILTGVGFGPAVSYYCAAKLGLQVTPILLFTTAIILGISGVTLLRALGPKVISTASVVLPAMLLKTLGVPDPGTPTDKPTA